MKSKNKKNTVWIVFTCIFALTTVVLAMALYRSHSTLEAMRVQLAEGQTNTQKRIRAGNNLQVHTICRRFVL